jgi:hypothetical protein
VIRVLRRILGPRRDELAGKWRNLHYQQFNDLYPIFFGCKNKEEWDGPDM